MNHNTDERIVQTDEISNCNNEVLTITQVAHMLQIGMTTAYELSRSQGFPTFYIGRQKRVFKDDLENWLKNKNNKKN